MTKRKVFKQQDDAPLFVAAPVMTRDEVIPPKSPGRVVDNFVNGLDLSDVLDTYKGGGTSAYHPKGLLKVILLAYMNNIYGCRPIAEMAAYDLRCLYFLEGHKPSHNTINRFRSAHLGKGGVLGIFEQLIELLVREGLVTFEEVYIDGTTIESRASRVRIVWQQTARYHAELNMSQIQKILDQAKACEAEDAEKDAQPNGGANPAAAKSGPATEPRDATEPKSEDEPKDATEPDAVADPDAEDTQKRGKKKRTADVRPTPEFINEIRAKADKLPLSESDKKELERRLQRAEELREQDEMCGSRSGTATTDPESVAAHPKDDKARKGPWRPMYDLLLITNRQFILDFFLAGTTSDMAAFPMMMTQAGNRYAGSRMAADAGFGSYRNIKLAMLLGIIPYFKYAMFDKEQSPRYAPPKYDGPSFPYDEESNTLKCPAGHRMQAVKEVKAEEYGIAAKQTIFRTDQCAQCPLRGECHRGDPKDHREVTLNLDWHYKVKPETSELLTSPAGENALKSRTRDVEPTNSHLKWAGAYRRLRHFGIAKCTMDLGLRCIAQNLKHYLSLVLDPTKLKKCRACSAHGAAGTGKSAIFCVHTAPFGPFWARKTRNAA